MHKIYIFGLSLIFSFLCLMPILPATSYALGPTHYFSDDLQDAQNGLQQVGGGGASIETIISTIISVLSFIVGIIAVIMIIVGSIKFITSGGDSNSVSSAKSTILYALIGLVIAVLAQVIIHYVVSVASNTCPSNSNIAANDKNCSITQ